MARGYIGLGVSSLHFWDSRGSLSPWISAIIYYECMKLTDKMEMSKER